MRRAEHADGHPTDNSGVQLKDIKKRLPLRVLSDADWHQWTSKGYIIIREAADAELVGQLVNVLWEFDEKDPNRPDTWLSSDRLPHRMKELNGTGMLEIYHHQMMWDLRQSKRIYDAFVDIWDREDLWVALDRANLNVPNPEQSGKPGFIHWDVDTSLSPLPIGVQGVLSLSGQDEEIGGFQCVPELFSDLENWISRQPEDRDPLRPDLSGFSPTLLVMNPGDLVIFNSLQPHGVRPNRSRNRARIAQYISMYPAKPDSVERDERIDVWRNMKKLPSGAFPGDPRGWEQLRYGPATLDELGRKLLGLQTW
ncbi:phytanoyl-CoA dioxygenase (plasmid) [Agrobacterium salinitolerans]|uniref:phytanoyl-CoA dioxygenase family protein n=1 Tax=Agrobacterium salinitolerans TaxID=1183413 RepID=UPI001C21F9DB|nr:phytanoyl-CoA dioxygenase [Agrobacterium salinitolerans]QXC52457.1 phytanoyl-CoA dioxygenase [Agrobacterium salinitolerans]